MAVAKPASPGFLVTTLYLAFTYNPMLQRVFQPVVPAVIMTPAKTASAGRPVAVGY
jgi:hypothetical protein